MDATLILILIAALYALLCSWTVMRSEGLVYLVINSCKNFFILDIDFSLSPVYNESVNRKKEGVQWEFNISNLKNLKERRESNGTVI